MALRNSFLFFITYPLFIFLLLILIKAKISPKNLLIRILLITFFVFVVIRLIGFVFKLGCESLQMDFSAFYTSGEALNYGLSPYQNHISHDPSIWDGIVIFKHSRFIYFPLFGVLFRPMALLPYLYAKFFWMLFSILCIVFALDTIRKTIGLENRVELSLIIGIFLCLFYPLLTFLERGQIYGLTLLIMTIAIRLMLKDRKARILSGILWAVASSIQVYCVLVFPFLVLRRKWKVVAGYIIGWIMVCLLTISITGPKLIHDYIFKEMPRIAIFGEGGTEEMMMPADIIRKYLGNVPAGMTVKDGIIYQPSAFNFVSNATLTKTVFGSWLSMVLVKLGLKVNMAITSIVTLGIFFLFMLLWQLYHRKQFSHFTTMQEVIYWQIILIIVLLSAPFTWVMCVIWVLPSLIIVLSKFRFIMSKSQAVYLYLCIIGLIIAALPDYYGFPFLLPFCEFLRNKYIYAEVLLFLSLLLLMKDTHETNTNISIEKS